MPTYEVYVKYEIEDSITVEAEDEYEAMDIAGSEEALYVVSHSGGYSLPWDNFEAYEAVEVGA